MKNEIFFFVLLCTCTCKSLYNRMNVQICSGFFSKNNNNILDNKNTNIGQKIV